MTINKENIFIILQFKMFDLNEIANLDYNAVDTVKPYALYVCQNFLEKPWTEISPLDFNLERIW